MSELNIDQLIADSIECEYTTSVLLPAGSNSAILHNRPGQDYQLVVRNIGNNYTACITVYNYSTKSYLAHCEKLGPKEEKVFAVPDLSAQGVFVHNCSESSNGNPQVRFTLDIA